MSTPWKEIPSEDMHSILIGLVGHDFGQYPEERIDEIRESRKEYASIFSKLVDLNQNDTVVDLGSGCGFGTYWFSMIAGHVIACDLSQTYLNFAAAQCADRENVCFMKIENGKLDQIEDASVSKIIAMSVFIHMNLYDIYYYFKEFSRILKPSGLVCIDVLDADNLDFKNPSYKEDRFLVAADLYYREKSPLSGLLNWNSERSVQNIARAHGFIKQQRFHDILLLRKDGDPPQKNVNWLRRIFALRIYNFRKRFSMRMNSAKFTFN